MALSEELTLLLHDVLDLDEERPTSKWLTREERREVFRHVREILNRPDTINTENDISETPGGLAILIRAYRSSDFLIDVNVLHRVFTETINLNGVEYDHKGFDRYLYLLCKYGYMVEDQSNLYRLSEQGRSLAEKVWAQEIDEKGHRPRPRRRRIASNSKHSARCASLRTGCAKRPCNCGAG